MVIFIFIFIFFDVFAEDDDEDGEDAGYTKRGKIDSRVKEQDTM